MTNTINIKRIILSVLIGTACLVSVFFPLFVLFLPGFLAALGLTWGNRELYTACLCAALGYIILSYILFQDVIGALYQIIIFIPSALIIARMLKKRASYRIVMLLAAFVTIIGLYISICLPSILAGHSPFYNVEQILIEYAEQFKNIDPSALKPPIDAELFEQTAEQMKTLAFVIPDYMLGGIIAAGAVSSGIGVLIARRLTPDYKAALRPMAPLSLWQLPKTFTFGAIVLIGGGWAMRVLKATNSDTIFYAVQVIVSLPLLLQGISMEAFFISVRHNKKAPTIIAIVLAVLFFPYSLIFFVGMGAMEQLLRLRNRFLSNLPPRSPQ